MSRHRFEADDKFPVIERGVRPAELVDSPEVLIAGRSSAAPALRADDAVPRPVADSPTWQSSAKCCGKDPTIFFHPEGERGAARKRRQRMAKAICMTCPVLDMCRQYSLAQGEKFGTWGGLTEEERARLLRQFP